MSKNVHINGITGELIPPEFAWLSHLYHGRGIASNGDSVNVGQPLSTGLVFEAMTVTLKRNAPAALMVLGCGCLALHYRTIVESNSECPAPLIVWYREIPQPEIQLWLLSIPSRGMREKYSLLLRKSTSPLGIDPKNPHYIGELRVDLFNGGKSATVMHGDIQPISTAS